MLKKILYFENYSSGLSVEYLLGKVNIGFNAKLNHRKLSIILLEIENIIKKLKEDGRFKSVTIKSHLLISRKSLKKDKINLINLKYIKMLKDKNYDFIQETKKISTFRKKYNFYLMKLHLIMKNIIIFNYSSMHEYKFLIPETNYMGILKISLK